MKLIASGGRELRGEDEVALVLAILGVDDDDHLAGADVLERLLDRAELGGRSRGLHGPVHELLDVLREHVHLQVHGRPGVERSRASSARASRGSATPRTPSSSTAGDRQRHAVDGDRALLDDVAQQLAGRAMRTTRAKPSSASRRDAADAVDVALDDVAAEPVAGAQRQLEVHLRPRRRAAPSDDAAQRLGHHVGARTVSAPAPRAVRQTPLTATESPSESSPASGVATDPARRRRQSLDRRRRSRWSRRAR